MMDSVDAVNAKQGTFYLYKKHDDSSINVAYFTWERLNTVIRWYAENGIEKYYYWQKTPAEAWVDTRVTSLSDERYIITDKLTMGTANYMIDGLAMSDEAYSIPGHHVLTVFDDWGNSYDVRVVIVDSSPILSFRHGNGDYYVAESVQPYYLKNRITLKITDGLDNFAMGIVRNSNRKILQFFNLGEELILPESGKYIVQTVNHSGMSVEYVFHISYTSTEIIVTENTITKRLDVSFTQSPDRDVTVESITIYRSGDGKEWSLLDNDDYGTTVFKDKLSYKFFKTGYYRFIIEDTCRTGIDAVNYEFYYEKPAPEIVVNYLPDNGYSNKPVSFSWNDEAYAVIVYDGVETEYRSGTELIEEGEYTLVFRDYDRYENTYSFTIDITPPVITLSREPIKGYIAEKVAVSIEEGSRATVYYSGNILAEYEGNFELIKDGSYRLEAVDKAGNISVIEFVIDTTPPKLDLIGVENGGAVKGAVAIDKPTEKISVKVYLNENQIDYTLGESLKEVGQYRVIITDEAGLTTEYTFEILYHLNAASIAVIVVLAIAGISGLISIIALRKRKKF